MKLMNTKYVENVPLFVNPTQNGMVTRESYFIWMRVEVKRNLVIREEDSETY